MLYIIHCLEKNIKNLEVVFNSLYNLMQQLRIIEKIEQNLFCPQIDPSHIQIQFEARDDIPCTARNLSQICCVANTSEKPFRSFLRAIHALKI